MQQVPRESNRKTPHSTHCFVLVKPQHESKWKQIQWLTQLAKFTRPQARPNSTRFTFNLKESVYSQGKTLLLLKRDPPKQPRIEESHHRAPSKLAECLLCLLICCAKHSHGDFSICQCHWTQGLNKKNCIFRLNFPFSLRNAKQKVKQMERVQTWTWISRCLQSLRAVLFQNDQ